MSDPEKKVISIGQLDGISDTLGRIANKLGAYDAPRSWAEIQALIRAGRIKEVCPVRTRLQVDKESGVSTTIHGSITAASVNEETFIAAIGRSGTAAYEFVFDGSAWHLHGEDVELTSYGISVTGTPAADDTVVVHVQADKIEFDVVAIDYYEPVNDALKHTITLWTADLLLYGSIPFCAPQKLVHVAEALPAGTYNITLDHGCYSGGTEEDSTYQFTTTQEIPAGGGIRHTTIGGWLSSGYGKAHVTGGTFITYNASGEVIEQGLVTTEGSGGTSLGTATARDPQYKVGDDVNFTDRQIYGENWAPDSANYKWLNSDAPGAASGQVASWWYASNKFDMPVKSTLPGFLHGIDPTFREVICAVRKRTAKSIANGYGYADTSELIFLPSMTELGFGKNNNISEVGVKADGTLIKETAWDMFIDATNDDRIRYQGGSARYYWLRSPIPSSGNDERDVSPSGALFNGSASYSYGVSAGLCLG
jgi:hypothetical protein